MGVTELICFLSERPNALDPVPGEQEQQRAGDNWEHVETGQGKQTKTWSFLPGAWGLFHVCSRFLSLWELRVGWRDPCRALTGSSAVCVWWKIYDNGKMEKEL